MKKISKETVIETALELLNEVGMDGLSTRKLAERLQVQQPALYWHFRDKRALFDALAHAMLVNKHSHALPDDKEDWRVFLKKNAQGFRAALLSYRDGARIHAGTRPTELQMDIAQTQIGFLRKAGFEAKNAVWALWTISHYVVGSVLEQQAAQSEQHNADAPTSSATQAATPPDLLALFQEVEQEGMDAAFDFGLNSLIAGLEPFCRQSTER
ncbi:MAG: tetracycline resistance transcriptional repressor TetR [Alcaligenes sp.]